LPEKIRDLTGALSFGRGVHKNKDLEPGRLYTCPMHLEIIQKQPGDCPKCGMALEPMQAVPEDQPHPELEDMTHRFWISAILTFPLLVLAMSAMWRGWLPGAVQSWVELTLAAPVVLWGGWPFFICAWRSLITWNLNMFTLIGLGVSVAFTYSLTAMFFSKFFPATFMDMDGRVAVYFEAAAVIVTLVLLGQVLELRVRTHTGMDTQTWENPAEALRQEGHTVVYVAVDKQIKGLLGISDPIKSTTFATFQKLQAEGIEIIMLTGESLTTAETVAKQLRMARVVAQVLPDQKAAAIKQLRKEGKIVAKAGDGTNDAPALAQAHVGIAMGTDTDVALKSAGVTLVKGDLCAIARAIALSRATMTNIKQNLLFAFVYNALGIPIAAGLLYSFFGVLLNPMVAAAAMSFSSVSVIGNALRLRRVNI
jgi:cation transport ATPase